MSEVKSNLISEQIQRDIAAGVFDQRSFFNVAELMEQYQASKVTIRDALHILCEKGFLISYPRRGYMVNYFSREEVNKIQGIRRRLESYGVQLVIANASDDEIRSLQTDEEVNSESGQNLRFHIQLAKLSGNEFLSEIVSTLVYKIAAARQEKFFWSNEERKKNEVFDTHRQIIDALLARDEARAIREIEKDIRFI